MKTDIVDIERIVQVDVYDSFEMLQSIRQQWDAFIESLGGEIFLTYDWCRIWWKYYGKNRDLRIFVFRSNKKLVGIIPFFFEKIWLGPTFLRVVKLVGSDFNLSHFSFPLAKDYIRVVVEKFSELLLEEKWDVLHIGPVAGFYEDYGDLKEALKQSFEDSNFFFDEEGEVQTYFELMDNWENHLSTISKNERGNIRRNYNYLRKSLCCKSERIESCFVKQKRMRRFRLLSILEVDYIRFRISRHLIGKKS